MYSFNAYVRGAKHSHHQVNLSHAKINGFHRSTSELRALRAVKRAGINGLRRAALRASRDPKAFGSEAENVVALAKYWNVI